MTKITIRVSDVWGWYVEEIRKNDSLIQCIQYDLSRLGANGWKNAGACPIK